MDRNKPREWDLQAENSVAYNVKHMLAIAFYSSDPSAEALWL
ncbi:MAG: hypothetical protein ACPGTQ_15560 [Colwellia sp.]